MWVRHGMLRALGERKLQGLEDCDLAELQARTAALIWLCLADAVIYHVMDLSSLVEVWKKVESRNMPVCSNGDLLLVSSRKFSDSWVLDM